VKNGHSHSESAALAQQLRGIAADVRRPRPSGHNVVLHYRVAAARADLLEVAALLEHARDPDPGCVTAIRGLLHDVASPLYDAAVVVGELQAILDHIRRRLRSGSRAEPPPGAFGCD
jgi:hypothetical protein